MDDMVDLGRDTRRARHNYIASLIYHGSDRDQWVQLQEKAAAEPGGAGAGDPAAGVSAGTAGVRAPGTALFVRRPEQPCLTNSINLPLQPAIAFLYKRIGTEHLMAAAGLSA